MLCHVVTIAEAAGDAVLEAEKTNGKGWMLFCALLILNIEPRLILSSDTYCIGS